jgi:hypothetical protein
VLHTIGLFLYALILATVLVELIALVLLPQGEMPLVRWLCPGSGPLVLLLLEHATPPRHPWLALRSYRLS